MNSLAAFLTALLLATALSACLAVRPESRSGFATEIKKSSKGAAKPGDAGFFGPGGGSFSIPGFNVPGFANGIPIGGGYGAGYGGPSGGNSRGGVIRPSVVCKERGPCYKKKLICPAQCFTSYSRSGKNYGAGGGAGGCTMDCKKRCVAYC